MLLCELVLNEGVKEFVVEEFVPGLRGEHLSEVRAALAHDRLEVDQGGALGGHRHVLGGCREPGDVRAVVDEHRLLPRDAQLQLWVGESDPHQNVYHPLTVVIGDGRQDLVERLDCHGISLSDRRRIILEGVGTVLKKVHSGVWLWSHYRFSFSFFCISSQSCAVVSNFERTDFLTLAAIASFLECPK